MSEENVELVRRLLDMFARRDHEAVFEFYDPDIEWDATAGSRLRRRQRTPEWAVSLVSRGSTVATRVFEPTGDAGWRRGKTSSSRWRTSWMQVTRSWR